MRFEIGIRRAEWTEQPRQHQHTKRRYVSTVTVNNFEGTIVIFEQRHIAETELNYKGFKTHGTVVGLKVSSTLKHPPRVDRR